MPNPGSYEAQTPNHTMENYVDKFDVKLDYERPQIAEIELDIEGSILTASGDDINPDYGNEL